jgi:hypothetical protein
VSTRRLLTLATLFAAIGIPYTREAPAQQARSAIVADTIRVGDVVPVAVRVTVERGERVLWPDTLPLADEALESVARVRERVDTLADGRLQVTGVYSLTPWRTGTLELPDLPLRVMADREVARTLTAELPALDVISVLPPDTAGVEPRPAKGVIGRSWSPWPFLLALLALAALVVAAVWWRRRRADAVVAPPLAPAVPPRERVLARLQEAREAGLVEQGAMKEFYTRVSEALREYLEAVGPGWGEDLTTTELLGRFRAQVGPEAAVALGRVLRAADQVKFARRRPDPGTAVEEWESVRAWVLAFDWPPRRSSVEGEEAA